MTPMINLHDIDVTKFLAVLDTCEGNVYLITSEDRKSTRLNSSHVSESRMPSESKKQTMSARWFNKANRRRQNRRSLHLL